MREIDLNLLVVFNQFRVEKRVSKVADNMGLTQPAVSNALARLRKLLGDELFLRAAGGMQPTRFATELAEPLAYALGMIHGALNQRSSFDPAGSRRAFTIGMTDLGEIYFMPALMDELARAAPGLTIGTGRNAAVNLRDEMEAGHVDLARGLLPQLKGGFFQRRLFSQRYVCLFRKGHRLDRHTEKRGAPPTWSPPPSSWSGRRTRPACRTSRSTCSGTPSFTRIRRINGCAAWSSSCTRADGAPNVALAAAPEGAAIRRPGDPFTEGCLRGRFGCASLPD